MVQLEGIEQKETSLVGYASGDDLTPTKNSADVGCVEKLMVACPVRLANHQRNSITILGYLNESEVKRCEVVIVS